LTRCVEKRGEALFVQVLGSYSGNHGTPCRVDDLGAAAVVQRDVEEHAAARRGPLDRRTQLILDVRREILHAAYHAKPDVVAQQRVELRPKVALQELHERPHLAGGPLPVLHREGEQRQDLDAEPCGRLDRIAHRVDAGAMPLDARQVPLRGPSPVAVHDDGDVHRQAIELDLASERLVRMPGRNPRQEMLTRHGSIPRRTTG
jgi:hypothetical protein